MHSDAAFLSKLLELPGDDDTRLVYADWLDDQDDPVSSAQAEFLRVTVELARQPGKKGWKKQRRKRLQALAAELDTSWLAVVSCLAIENCQRTQAEQFTRMASSFEFVCDRRWEDLQTTDNQAVRSCDACRQNVHYCDTITEARQHAWDGHCIAIDLGVLRCEGDLEYRGMMMVGQPSEESLRREAERMQPDAVSAEREQRKRKEDLTPEKT
jgi:uncharacterized protein (TIGR02996 family)